MSFLVVEIVPEGIVFGADRHITTTLTESNMINGILHHKVSTGFGTRSKVLRWPNKKAVVGYVGAAKTGGLFTDEWLMDFIGSHHDFSCLQELAKALKKKVQDERQTFDGNNSQAQIIHLAGFEKGEDGWKPQVFYISNCWSLVDGEYADVRKEFGEYPDVFAQKYVGKRLSEIRKDLDERAKRYEPRWFHQGFGLKKFNCLKEYMNRSLKELVESKAMKEPSVLADWEKQVKFSVLMYGAYFQSFEDDLSQYVGGGVDTVSLAWPD